MVSDERLKEIIEAVKVKPSAKDYLPLFEELLSLRRENRWIPASIDPVENGPYSVYIEEFFGNGVPSTKYVDQKHWNNGWNLLEFNSRVLFWKPLPETPEE